jgi:hypothetical protein
VLDSGVGEPLIGFSGLLAADFAERFGETIPDKRDETVSETV